MKAADCCAAVRLVPDERFRTVFGGISERVVRCEGCGAMWLEEWTSRAGYDGAEDRELFDYRRVTEAEATQRLGLAVD